MKGQFLSTPKTLGMTAAATLLCSAPRPEAAFLQAIPYSGQLSGNISHCITDTH